MIIDEYTRRCITLDVSRGFKSCDIIDRLSDLFVMYGMPEHIRSDNGPEFMSKAIRDWLGKLEVKTLYIEPGSPWENGYTESFNSRLRDELLMVEQYSNRAHARASANAWREDYNNYRPHSSLGGQTPEEFARRCAAFVPAGRVGTGDCSPAPLTEPDLWAHIRLLKLYILEQHKLSLDLRGWLELLPSNAKRY